MSTWDPAPPPCPRLPDQAAAALRSIAAPDALATTVAAFHDAGWSLSALAEALHITWDDAWQILRRHKPATRINRSPRHGLTGYIRDACRCGTCRQVGAAARARHANRPRDEIPHGTERGYTHYRCRCAPCRQARSAYRAHLKARTRHDRS